MIAAAALLAALLVSCSGAAEAAEPTRTDRSDPWLTLGPGQASTLNEYQSATVSAPPSDYRSATQTARPSRPECSQKGYFAYWEETEWSECRRPTAPECDSEYPVLLWVDGEWGCYEGCDADEVPRQDPDTEEPYCYPLPDCGAGLASVYIEESDTYECSEMQETADQFWEYAAHHLGTLNADLSGKWIGGLAEAYNKRLWLSDFRTDMEHPPQVWSYTDSMSYMGNFQEVAEGTAHVHICYDHDCETPGNLVGSTNSALSSCRAFVWSSETGMWFAMKIDEVSAVCVDAYRRTASGTIIGASTGARVRWEDTGETQEKDGAQMPVYYGHENELQEITLVVISRNGEYYSPADNHTWVSYRNFG